MPSRAQMETAAEIHITEVIERHGPLVAEFLASLHLLEAVAMICFLADATLARLAPDERMKLAEAMTKTIIEDAKDTVDTAGNARRD